MEYLPIIAIVVSVGGLLFQYFGWITKILGRFAEITGRLIRLETQIDLYWKSVESVVIGALKTFPTDIGKDVLLDKLMHNELTLYEAERLRTILEEEMKQNNDYDKMWAYALSFQRLAKILVDLRESK